MRADHARAPWGPFLYSFLLHAVLLTVIAFGWFHMAPPAPQAVQLAIEAAVVTELPAQPAPAEEAPPAPQPDPAAAKAKAEAEAAEQARLAQEKKAADARKAANERRAEQQRIEAEAADAARQKKQQADRQLAAQRKAEAEQKAQLEKRKAEEERQKQAELQRKAELQKQAEQEAKAREQAADLRARMAAEERLTAARSGSQAAQYKALIRARIERAWIRPPSARAGLDCEVRVTQVPGGAVTAVKIERCNGDAAVRESIEAAVYRASPLPMPENPDLFERDLLFNFRPND